jgi:hypothetical protein
MKRFIKWALALILLIGIGAGATIYYFTKVKQYDVADKQVDEITKQEYTLQLPEGAPLPEGVKRDPEGLVLVDEKGHYILEDGSTVDPEEWLASGDAVAANGKPASTNGGKTASTETAGSKPTGTDGKTGTGQPNESGTAEPEGETTVETIKDRYRPSFSNLQGQAQSRLGALVGQAKNEYATKKANGESINPAYFYQKYSGAAAAVEAKTDAAFNTVYSSLKSDLKANNYSPSHAEQFKKDYEATKAAQKDALMSKITGG